MVPSRVGLVGSPRAAVTTLGCKLTLTAAFHTLPSVLCISLVQDTG